MRTGTAAERCSSDVVTAFIGQCLLFEMLPLKGASQNEVVAPLRPARPRAGERAEDVIDPTQKSMGRVCLTFIFIFAPTFVSIFHCLNPINSR